MTAHHVRSVTEEALVCKPKCILTEQHINIRLAPVYVKAQSEIISEENVDITDIRHLLRTQMSYGDYHSTYVC